MATVSGNRVNVFDDGSGVDISAVVHVDVQGQTVEHKITMSRLGLTPAQVQTVQSIVTAIRNRSETVTRTDFDIP